MVGYVGSSQSSESFGAMSLNELAELLFCSSLQPSQYVDENVVCAALAESLHAHHGQVAACAEELAACYGKDPEVTCHRMRWARTVVTQAYGRRVAAG
ncbi:MAG: hypothetical protein ACT4QF_11010 [Sporichthyaceae bacterium]